MDRLSRRLGPLGLDRRLGATRRVHDRHPRQGCAIAFEFKKFFMDEWTGVPDPAELDAMQRLVRDSAVFFTDLIGKRHP